MSKAVKQQQKAKGVTPAKVQAPTDEDFFSEQPVESLAEMLDREQAAAVERARAEVQVEPVEAQVALEMPVTMSQYDYRDIQSAPRNGLQVFVSATGADVGERVFWKRTRAFANATHRWEETGFFVDIITNVRVAFEPKYWRSA